MKNMRNIIRYICCMLVAVATSCTDDAVYVGPEQEPDVSESDDVVTLKFSVAMPEPVSSTSRAMGDAPDYGNLKLYCLVFQDNGNPSSNFFVDKVEASAVEGNGPHVDAVTGLTYVPFEVKLIATTGKAILHFVAINTANLTKPEDDPLSQRLEFAPENVIMPRLTTTGGRDAYWQRIVLGCRISTETEEQIKELVSEFSPVPLIRNFARVSVELGPTLKDRQVSSTDSRPFFELEGFCVVNTLDRGTIAAFNGQSSISFPSFGELGEKVGDEEHQHRGFAPYNYEKITKEVKYTGSVAAGSKLNTAPPTNENEFNVAPKYIYERPFTETLHTYVIVKGKFNGTSGTVTGTGETSYYKLDIGRTDDRGLFQFTNMLRNFDFKIVINNVETNGYTTIADAANGMIYNNNLSASVESRPLLSISDGHEMIYVNMTSYVCVDGEPIDLYYRYFELNGNDVESSRQIFSSEPGGVIWNDAVDGCVPGPVIKEANYQSTYHRDTIMQGTTLVPRIWEHVKIIPNSPTDKQAEQVVTLYKRNGLSRTVTLYLKTPWEVEDSTVYPGQWDHRERSAKDYPQIKEGIVSSKGKKNLTVFFDLPHGLPKAMFPLKFVIESNRQNIENAKVGTIVVQSGPSIFDGLDDIRIQYVKTVTWDEYDPDNKSDDPDSREDNYDENGNYIGNVIRCRFLTITDVDKDAEITQTETTLKITNPYFKDFFISFTRSSEVDEPNEDDRNSG